MNKIVFNNIKINTCNRNLLDKNVNLLMIYNNNNN